MLKDFFVLSYHFADDSRPVVLFFEEESKMTDMHAALIEDISVCGIKEWVAKCKV